jgi:DNA polymerase-3 subunit delta
MAYQKPGEAFSQWSSGDIKPVYLFAGDESYLAENALHRLENSLKIDALNREVFYGAEATAIDIASASQTMPFISDKRLVIVKDAQKIRSSEAAKLADFLESPSESSCIVLIWLDKIKKDSLKSPLFASVERSGAVIEFKPLYERDMAEWVRAEVTAGKKTIAYDAVTYLIQESGSSLMDLHNELEKLFLFVGDKKEIGLADVESLSGHTKQSNLFQLSEAIESKNIKSSISVLKSLLEEGEAPVLILSFVHRAVRRLLTAKSLMEEMGLPKDEVSRKLQLHRFFDRNFFQLLGKYTMRELKKDMRLVLEADIEIKSSSRPEGAILEELFLALSGN